MCVWHSIVSSHSLETFKHYPVSLWNSFVIPAATYRCLRGVWQTFIVIICRQSAVVFRYVMGACLLWACSAADWSVCSLQLCFSQTRKKAWVDRFKLPSRWIDSTMGPLETRRWNAGEVNFKLFLTCGFAAILNNRRLHKSSVIHCDMI